jgi:hypothetical protein
VHSKTSITPTQTTMKKFIIIILLFSAGFESLFSQQLSIGVKSSFLILNSTLITDYDRIPFMEVKPKASYAIGVTISDQIKRFGIKIEPRFIVKGYKLKFMPSDIDIYRYNYISMPLIFSFAPIQHLNLELGPEFSYMLNSKVKYFGGNDFIKNESRNFIPLEISLISGVTYNLKFFDLGLRYGLGLTAFDKGQFHINSDPFAVPPVNYRFNHKYFEIYLNTPILKIKK